MSSPLRHRSPQKDPENGPTPKKIDSAAGTASKTPASSVAAHNGAPQESFLKRHKKKLIAAFVLVAIIAIAVGASSAKSSSSSASTGNTGKKSGSGSSPAPSEEPTDLPTDAPTDVPTSDVTSVPTAAPTPRRLEVCPFPENLGVAGLFNAFFEETFWSNGSSIEGRLAAGGDVYANQFATGRYLYDQDGLEIPCPQPDGMNYAMVVGGALTINGSTVYNGGLVYGSVDNSLEDSVNITTYNVEGGCSIDVGSVSNVLDFSSGVQHLKAVSSAINAINLKRAQPTRKIPGTLFFKLNGTIMTEYFKVKESDLMAVNTIELQGTPLVYNGTTATIVMNVVMDFENDAQTFLYQGWNANGFDSYNQNILWNFPNYVNITLQNGNWPGSILAPDATMENCIGEIRGSVFAKSWNTGKAINNIKIRGGVFNGTVFWDQC